MAEGGFIMDDTWEKLMVGPSNFKYSVSRQGPYTQHSPHFLGKWLLVGSMPVDNIATR